MHLYSFVSLHDLQYFTLPFLPFVLKSFRVASAILISRFAIDDKKTGPEFTVRVYTPKEKPNGLLSLVYLVTGVDFAAVT
jgi:hypothetical protein